MGIDLERIKQGMTQVDGRDELLDGGDPLDPDPFESYLRRTLVPLQEQRETLLARRDEALVTVREADAQIEQIDKILGAAGFPRGGAASRGNAVAAKTTRKRLRPKTQQREVSSEDVLEFMRGGGGEWTISRLANEYGVSVSAATRAMRKLRDEQALVPVRALRNGHTYMPSDEAAAVRGAV